MLFSFDLTELLTMEMPIEQQRRDGFMDIVDVQYHENTISGIYAYFLNRKKNAVIADLFLNSLLRMATEKSKKQIEIGNHFCQLERQTDKGNRIDMLIKTGNEEFIADDYAIIIENKIFGNLHNDLLDYWDSVKIPVNRKIGILLTLRPVPIPDNVNEFFINITHTEWMREIRLMGLPCDLDVHLYVYLTDFIKNMENIVTSTDTFSEDAQFFFQHTSKVLRAMKTYDAARDHVINQLRVFAEKIGLQLYGNSSGWRHVWDYKSHVYYAIGFDQTLKEDLSIRVILEVYKDGIARKQELRELLNTSGYFPQLLEDNVSNQSWAHLAYLDYKLSKNDLEHLGTALYDKIQRDFSGAYQLVYSALHGVNQKS